MEKTKLDVMLLHDGKFISFEFHTYVSYVWRSPFWTIDHFQREEGLALAMSLYL